MFIRCIYIILVIIVMFNELYSQLGGKPGAFSRLGFAARGMAMGNAMSAITSGDISSYYNPALVPFTGRGMFNITYSFLTLDRYLNFLSYGQTIKPSAGISLGLINSGVRDIEERDSDGNLLGTLNTSENLFFLSFGNQVHKNISIGITFKLFYHKLYTGITSTTVGFDLGILSKITSTSTIGLVIKDINSKYQWNTTSLYGRAGANTTDQFPRLLILSFAYKLPSELGLASIEFENSTAKTNQIRFGTELILHQNFTVRAGLDRFIYNNNYSGIKPTFGYSFKLEINKISISLDYAYVIESFSPGNIHILTLILRF